MLYGVNVHHKPYGDSNTNYLWSTAPLSVDVAASCGFGAVRVDASNYTVDTTLPNRVSRTATYLSLCKDRKLKTQMAYISPFKFSRTDFGAFADSAAGRYSMGYTLLRQLLLACPVKPDYIELENEVTLQLGMLWNQGQNVSDYNTTAFNEYADIMLGELAAAREVAPNAKVICGTVQGNYGFIPWLLSKGISMDIAGYHAYMRPIDSLENWFTLGKPLRKVFQDFGLPVSVNEINGNVSLGQPTTGTEGKRLLDAIVQWPEVESVFAYELFDSAVEPGFGLVTPTVGGWTKNANSLAFLNAFR